MKLLVANHESGGNMGLAKFEVHQQLKQLEDDIVDATFALRATRSCADDMHHFLVHGSGQKRHDHASVSVASEMHLDICKELDLLLKRADSLRQKLKTSVGLVSLKKISLPVALIADGLVIASSSCPAFSDLKAVIRYNNYPEKRRKRTRKWRKSLLEA